jgi:hypothetical protein
MVLEVNMLCSSKRPFSGPQFVKKEDLSLFIKRL